MKRLSLGLLFVTCVHADWTSDILKKSTEFYDQTREKTIQIYRDTLTTKPQTHEDVRKERLTEAWDTVIDQLQEGTYYIDELKTAPDSSWIGRDKAAVQEDIDQLFNRIIKGLVGRDMIYYKEKIADLKEKIDKNRSKILIYRERRIGAPEKSKLHTTKKEYSKKIDALKEENSIYENDIRIIKESLQQSFNDIGVMLSMEQVDVLLTRIDGNDIIQMSLAMDTLKYVTAQILQLMKESNEELKQAKKYYGMHQVLLELVVYIQQKYIDKSNDIYLPKIEKLITDTANMIEETKVLKAKDEDPRRVSVYKHNIEALLWTLKVAKQYRLDLIHSRDRIVDAQKVAKANLRVSKNTYAAVSLSAELYDIVSESQEMYIRVSKIQVPDIVPFKNIQIKKKYRELTEKLQ